MKTYPNFKFETFIGQPHLNIVRALTNYKFSEQALLQLASVKGIFGQFWKLTDVYELMGLIKNQPNCSNSVEQVLTTNLTQYELEIVGGDGVTSRYESELYNEEEF